MPNPYSPMMSGQNQMMGQPDWMSAAPSPYQQGMQNPYAQAPMRAPMDTSFSDRQAAVGQQLASQPRGNAGGSVGGMGGGLGGPIDPQRLAQGLKKFGEAANPYLPNTQMNTAEQFGTNPYSEQSRMIAQQNQGLMS